MSIRRGKDQELVKIVKIFVIFIYLSHIRNLHSKVVYPYICMVKKAAIKAALEKNTMAGIHTAARAKI